MSILKDMHIPRQALVGAVLLFLANGTVRAQLSDTVFRQASKLTIKLETYDLVVKDKTDFKVFLENNMDRGIPDLSLEVESKAFDFEVKPKAVAIARDKQAFFQVTMKARSAAKPGSYPVKFRLVTGGRVLKSMSIEAEKMDGKPDEKTPPELSAKSAATNAPKPAAAAPAPAAVDLQARAVSAVPAVDGAINEPAWKTAAALSGFSSSRGGRAVYDTTGLLLFDRQNLYFGFLCKDENPDALTQNDYIEIRLSFNQAGTPCYIMRLSPSGKAGLKRLLGGELPADWMGTDIRFAIGREKKSWTAEIAIPFAAVNEIAPAAARKMFLRIARCKASGKVEDSYWSAGQDGSNSENEFGEITLAP